MSVRFPHHGSGRQEMPSHARPADPIEGTQGRPLRDTPEDIPNAACCCPAKPQVKVLMPATASRPHPVDLWLCGHHWRASRTALAKIGATVYDVSAPGQDAAVSRENAPV